jgi:hypothetical protein
LGIYGTGTYFYNRVLRWAGDLAAFYSGNRDVVRNFVSISPDKAISLNRRLPKSLGYDLRRKLRVNYAGK